MVVHRACRSGDLPALEAAAASHGPIVLRRADHNGWTPLHHACRAGHLSLVQFLLAKGLKGGDDATGDPILEIDEEDGPLREEVHPASTEAWLASKTFCGLSPLGAALARGHATVARWLLAACDMPEATVRAAFAEASLGRGRTSAASTSSSLSSAASSAASSTSSSSSFSSSSCETGRSSNLLAWLASEDRDVAQFRSVVLFGMIGAASGSAHLASFRNQVRAASFRSDAGTAVQRPLEAYSGFTQAPLHLRCTSALTLGLATIAVVAGFSQAPYPRLRPWQLDACRAHPPRGGRGCCDSCVVSIIASAIVTADLRDANVQRGLVLGGERACRHQRC